MSYLKDHQEFVKKQREAYETITLAHLRETLLDNLEDYDEKYSAFARDADAWDPEKDNIRILLTAITLHKSLDIAQSWNEVYVVSNFADDGRKKGPQTFVNPNYMSIKKGETYVFTHPPQLYGGNPRGAIHYALSVFETKKGNHDTNVQAADKIIKNVGNLTAGALTAVSGPAAGAIAKLVTDAASTALTIAKEHKDELAASFPGSLLNTDINGKGPYSLAKPEISLDNGTLEANLLVVREAGEARKRRPRRRPQKSPVTQRAAPEGVILNKEMLSTRFSASRFSGIARPSVDS